MTETRLEALFCRDDGAPLPVIASVFTPYQLLFFERIRSLVSHGPLMILDSRPPAHRASRAPRLEFDELVALDLTGQVNDRGQAELLRSALAATERFAAGGEVCFVSASYQWPVNNTIYHHHRRDRQWRFLLQDDGLSSYLDLRPSPRERLRNLMREAVARLRGFPARSLIGGHPLGHDIAELQAIILGLTPATRMPGQDRMIVLPAERQGIVGAEDAVLFVGQPYMRHVGRERIEPFAHNVAAVLRELGYAKLAFKAHHFQLDDEVEIYRRAGFELFESSLPLEEVLGTSGFRTIASVNSTALLTSKALFGDGIRSIAFNLNKFKILHEKRDEGEVEALFRSVGVELREVA